EYGPTEILPPVGAKWKALRVSADLGATAAALTRAESRGSPRTRAAWSERQTLRWREMDSNHWFRREEGTALFETTLIGLRPLHFRGKQLTSPERPGVRARFAPAASQANFRSWRNASISWSATWSITVRPPR